MSIGKANILKEKLAIIMQGTFYTQVKISNHPHKIFKFVSLFNKQIKINFNQIFTNKLMDKNQ